MVEFIKVAGSTIYDKERGMNYIRIKTYIKVTTI